MNIDKLTSIHQLVNPLSSDIFLETGYENSNPSDPEMIKVDTNGKFNVTQFFEENAAKGYSFHLNIALCNRGLKPVIIPLCIIWGEKEYDFCRDYMYIGYNSGKTWRMLSISSNNGITDTELVIPPGRHLLCCTPQFNVTDYLSLINKCDNDPIFDIIDVSVTPMGIPVKCLKFGDNDQNKMVITTRAHPYETAGGYCLSGWLEYLKENQKFCEEYSEKICVYFFPMINPDGVLTGRCNLAPTGVNFGNSLANSAAKDCSAKGLVEFIQALKPDYYLDMHNNTGPHLVDSFRSNDDKVLNDFANLAPDYSYLQKIWKTSRREFDQGYLFMDCHKKFGTKIMVTEFPWYTRTPSEMKNFGTAFLNTLIKIITRSIKS